MADTPDYYKYLPNSVRLSLQDMGELASRLGSPMIYDRRGEVLFQDYFSHGLTPYRFTTSGAGNSYEISAAQTMFGGYSLKATIANSNLQNVGLAREFSMSNLGRTGLETSVLCDNIHHLTRLKIIQYDGLTQRLFEAGLDAESGEILLLLPSGLRVVVSTIDFLGVGADVFRNMKLVVDLETMSYVRLLVDKQNYDLSAYSGFTGAISLQRNYLAQVTMLTRTAVANTIYCGHVIITGNEP
jgi:hypothetical protein